MIKEMYNTLQRKDKEIRSLKPSAILEIINVNQIPKPISFTASSFPKAIMNHIHHYSLNLISYTFFIEQRHFTIHFIVEEPYLNVSIYNKYAHKIMLLLSFLGAYSNHPQCSKTLTIFIYMTSKCKMLPSSNIDILSEEHVNTAFTYSCPKNAEIIIFRKEEWFKVLIHEMFHSFGLDFASYSASCMNYAKKEILHLFPVDSEVNLVECYNECWARILNVIFSSYVLSVDFRHFYKLFSYFIWLEKIYSCFQMVKILDFMSLTYKDLYSKNVKSTLARETLYKEDTSVLSYYVITFILLNNDEDFLHWCVVHNTPTLLLQFNTLDKNMISFCKFIQQHYKKDASHIEECQHILQSIPYHVNANANTNYILQNTRMTIVELE